MQKTIYYYIRESESDFMNKKGFTLLELIYTVVLIAIIALMSIPYITSFVKKSEDDKYNIFLNDIYLATEAYLQKYIDDYPELGVENGVAYIYMQELVEEKFVNSNLVNPKYCDAENNCIAKKISTCNDEDCAVDDYTIVVTREEDGTFSYRLENDIITN